MDHRLAQVLGVGLAAGVTQRHFVGDAIVGDQLRVLDGQVVRPLFEVADRIAAGAHDLAEQVVGVADRRARIVDELGLHPAPAAGEPCGFFTGQRANVKSLDALLAALEGFLGPSPVAVFVDRGDILGPIMRPQLLRPPPLGVAHRDDDSGDDDDRYGDQDCGVGVHLKVSSAFALRGWAGR